MNNYDRRIKQYLNKIIKSTLSTYKIDIFRVQALKNSKEYLKKSWATFDEFLGRKSSIFEDILLLKYHWEIQKGPTIF